MNVPLLIEIGVEELPPAAMQPLADEFAKHVERALRTAEFETGATSVLATPRRLAICIDAIADSAPPVEVEKHGPAVDIAFDDAGKPTAAADGFARSVGVPVEQLARESTSKGERLVFRSTQPGAVLSDTLDSVINQSLAQLSIPKRMRWGDHDYGFVRPVHWVVCLHGATVIPCQVMGVDSDRFTRGHRFHHPDAIALEHARDYETQLHDQGWVIADPAKRRALIESGVETAATQLDARPVVHEELIIETVALVEYPVALAGTFDDKYLTLPREVLIATMESHQRYFPVADANGSLVAGFVTIANLASRDPAEVIAGNERVIRPRLDDALFFWNQDRRHSLEENISKLAGIAFQKSLGTMADKSERVRRIAARLCPLFGVTLERSNQAARLAKADLVSEMVDEFPTLQGIMGGYYASDGGEASDVARAIAEHYQPESASAPIPTTANGRLLALADRLDTLAGIFAIGGKPSGDKDPFALRRAALGVVRILIESKTSIDLVAALAFALEIQPVDASNDILEALRMFHVERMRSYYLDQGVSAHEFDAVAAVDHSNPYDLHLRLAALRTFCELPEATTVSGSHKRIRNLLRREAPPTGSLASNRLVADAEIQLARLLNSASEKTSKTNNSTDYAATLQRLAAFAEPLDRFFDEVRVITDDAATRNNRLLLLSALDRRFRDVADISYLAA